LEVSEDPAKKRAVSYHRRPHESAALSRRWTPSSAQRSEASQLSFQQLVNDKEWTHTLPEDFLRISAPGL